LSTEKKETLLALYRIDNESVEERKERRLLYNRDILDVKNKV
tara:strand:- start:263 stop:388 length:126 start_codon:yes stop_codon:yes gene_type:complete